MYKHVGVDVCSTFLYTRAKEAAGAGGGAKSTSIGALLLLLERSPLY